MKKYCKSPKDVPVTPHYAIIEFNSTSVGDDGYGQSGYVESNSYIAFDNKEEWETEIHNLLNPTYGSKNDRFVAMHVNPATYKVSTSVNVNLNH